jgi:hypothetical protein
MRLRHPRPALTSKQLEHSHVSTPLSGLYELLLGHCYCSPQKRLLVGLGLQRGMIYIPTSSMQLAMSFACVSSTNETQQTVKPSSLQLYMCLALEEANFQSPVEICVLAAPLDYLIHAIVSFARSAHHLRPRSCNPLRRGSAM